MAKRKVSNRKKDSPREVKKTTEYIGESEEKLKTPEISEGPEEVPIKEYNETLYSRGSVQKQPASTVPEKKQPLKRTRWESISTIEQNVDTMGRRKIDLQGIRAQMNSDIDQKVDYILLKKKGQL